MSENEINDEEIGFADNQTSEEMNELMAKEGLVALPEEERQEIFIEEDRLKSLLESILFSSPKPLTFDAIKTVFKGTNIKSKQLRRAMEDYAQDLANQQRGVYIEEIAGGYQLRTKIENADFLKQVVKQRPFRISGPSMEVMAIMAYKQPCIKAEVDTIRGVESGHLIRVLMDKGLLQFDGKSDLPGKPMLYKTTKKFLEVFGLRNIRELPSLEEIDQLIPEGIGGEEEEKTTLDTLTGELSLDYGARDQEAEEEFSKITDRLSEITTSSEYFEKEKERQREQKEKDKADDIRERMIMGQSVEVKEINWLKRYEDRLVAGEPAPVEATESAVPTEETAATEATTEEAGEPEVEDVSTLANAAADAFKMFDEDDDPGKSNA
jgi:segregation and condensation protein B